MVSAALDMPRLALARELVHGVAQALVDAALDDEHARRECRRARRERRGLRGPGGNPRCDHCHLFQPWGNDQCAQCGYSKHRGFEGK